MLSFLNKIINHKNFYLCTFCLLMLFMTLIVYLLYNPLCEGYDFNYHYNRFYTLIESFKEGTFPCYMDYYVINGYGYLCKIFYSDFLFIPFAALAQIIDPILAFNLMLAVFTFLSGLFTYLAFSSIFKNKYGAIIAGILYACASYRLFDIYVRSAIGESMAITFIPLILWGAYEIIKGNYKKWYILSIGFSLTIYSHAITSEIAFILLLITVLISCKTFIKEPIRLLYLIISGIVCIFITAYTIVPMLEHMSTNSFFFNKYKMFEYPYAYNYNLVIEGMFRLFDNPKSGYFTKLGALIVMLPLILCTLIDREKNNKNEKISNIFILTALFLTFTTTNLFPWYIYPFSEFNIQFASRSNPIITLLFTICTGYYISELAKNRKSRIAALGVLLAINIIAINGDSTHYKNFTCHNELPEIEVDEGHMGILNAEFLPAKFPLECNTFTLERGKIVTHQKESTLISNFAKDKGHITFDIVQTEADQLELPLTYYIGYKATLNNQPIAYTQSENGLIELPVNASGRVEIIYTGTTLQKISMYITLISILILASYMVVTNTKRKI